MRLFAVVGAAAVLSGVDSEALPSGPHALLRPATSAPVVGRRNLGIRPDVVPVDRAALCSLRGGGFSWGTPEPTPSPRRGRGDDINANPDDGSDVFGILGNAMSAAWGGGGSSSKNKHGDRDKTRVDTKGPPDLNPRLPPTAPGASDSSFSRYTSSQSNNSFGRDRAKTVDPPDVTSKERSVRDRDRRGARANNAPAVRRFFSGGQPSSTPPESPGWEGDSGRTTGGGFQPYWPNSKTSDSGGRRNEEKGNRVWAEPPEAPRGLMAVHYLILSCFGLFSLNTIFRIDRVLALSLDHTSPAWWQPATSLLLHGDQYHLMGNMFNLLVFGKMAEEDMGSVGMLLSFLTCGVVSSLVSLAVMPKNMFSCGASGAIFGLYSVCVLGKMFNLGWRRSPEGRLRKLIEACVFGWFVVESVMSELRMVAGGGVVGTDHAAHFGGVLAGALFILLARRSIREGNVQPQTFD